MKPNRAETNPEDIDTTDNLGGTGTYKNPCTFANLGRVPKVGTSHPLSVGKLILRVETIIHCRTPHTHFLKMFLNPPLMYHILHQVYHLGKFMLSLKVFNFIDKLQFEDESVELGN